MAVAPDGDGDGGFGVGGELFFGVVDGLFDGPHDLGWCRVEFSGEVWVVAFEAADEPLVEQVVNGEPAEAAVAGGCGDAHVAAGSAWRVVMSRVPPPKSHNLLFAGRMRCGLLRPGVRR